jgi:flagellar hook-basal body complex protein FliE
MTISSIEGMLQQLRGLAQVAGGGTRQTASAATTALRANCSARCNA